LKNNEVYLFFQTSNVQKLKEIFYFHYNRYFENQKNIEKKWKKTEKKTGI
jgi:hypothetical protein